MKVEQQFSDPEYVTDRRPYRLRIEGKDGQAIEIVEQMGGGFLITSVTSMLSSSLVVYPVADNKIIIKDAK